MARHLVTEASDHYICPLCDPPKKSKGRQKTKLLKIIVILAASIAGFSIQKYSYNGIHQLRQLSRIPQTQILAAVSGEVNLTGKAQPSTERNGSNLQTVSSPDTGTACYYYSYLKEREVRDSDGNTDWVTVEERTDYVPFHLRDSTGEILIEPAVEADFNIKISHQRRSGDLRYTERRIDPNNRLFIFGYLEKNVQGTPAVTFTEKGDYHPLISEETEHGERNSRAASSVWLCWQGLGLFALATSCLFTLFRLHRILIFFGLLTFVISGTLLFQGVKMMASDLSGAQNRVHRQEKVIRNLIQTEFAPHQISWDGSWQSLGNISDYKALSAKSRARLRRIRIDLAIAARRSNSQAEDFPYNLVQPFISTPKAPVVDLPSRDEKILKKLNSQFKETQISSLMAMITSGIALFVGIVTLIVGFKKLKNKRLIENLPTTPISGVTYGLTEVVGIAELQPNTSSLRAPLSNKSCVAYHYTIREKQGSGKNTRWVLIHNEKKHMPFMLHDRDGEIAVDPNSAKISYFQNILQKRGGQRHRVKWLQLGEPVYAMASAKLDPVSGDKLYLAKDEKSKMRLNTPFILSSFQESHLLRSGGAAAVFILNITFAAILLAGLMFFAALGTFNPASYLAAALIGPALMILITIAMHYNDILFLRQRARRNWSNIDVALQKRHDLIPQLEAIAKESITYEKELQAKISQLRTNREKDLKNASKLDPQIANSHEAVVGIVALIEDLAQINAGSALNHLIRQLIACENEIAFISAGFNDAVETYNTRIATLPDIILAKAFNFRSLDLLKQAPETLVMPVTFQKGS